MYKFLLIFSLCITSTLLKADPSPFSLEISKTKISELKSKYKATFLNKNKYSNGDMYNLNVDELGIDGLQKATAIFDQNKTLAAVLTTFPKFKFDYLYGAMNKKYKLAKKNIPFVGNKSAEFKSGKSTVFLDAPHLGFESTLNYVQNDFWNAYLTLEQKAATDQKAKEQSKL